MMSTMFVSQAVATNVLWRLFICRDATRIPTPFQGKMHGFLEQEAEKTSRKRFWTFGFLTAMVLFIRVNLCG